MPCTDQKPSFQKRRFLWACALAATAALPAAALAERFPERPISFVVPFPPGGPTDAMARTLAISLTETLGQSVI
ncbi:MAG: tripartite tricarboxylate transporter substrate binding protein, partial [Delftia sp.]|nr:tripartite tricarboxylate transporter substrate binding protein [Delftia sp.]